MSNFEQDEDREELPREPGDIEMSELNQALRSLVMLGDDPFLGMQATNIALVDKWLMPLETEARSWRANDDG